MSKHYRPCKIDESQLLPPSVQDYVPESYLFIVALMRESLDLAEIEASYASLLGQPPFDPALMAALLLNGYASGINSSRRIAKACTERADFMMIVAGGPPDLRTISCFGKRHLKALAELFVQVLKLCEPAGLVRLGRVALDGTKIKANASKHKAMSYARMKQREAQPQAEVNRWPAAAEAADAEEDRRHGSRHGDEMLAWIADGMDVSRPAVSQHLKVLKDAGLVVARPKARGGCTRSTREALRRFAGGSMASRARRSPRSRRGPRKQPKKGNHDDRADETRRCRSEQRAQGRDRQGAARDRVARKGPKAKRRSSRIGACVLSTPR
jgi:transposase/DNA-binding transcriptional ArsR family regulator